MKQWNTLFSDLVFDFSVFTIFLLSFVTAEFFICMHACLSAFSSVVWVPASPLGNIQSFGRAPESFDTYMLDHIYLSSSHLGELHLF